MANEVLLKAFRFLALSFAIITPKRKSPKASLGASIFLDQDMIPELMSAVRIALYCVTRLLMMPCSVAV